MRRNTATILVCGCLAWLAGCCCCCKKCADGETRAGHPSEVSPLAKPSDDGHYIGYTVGGGSACHGDGPTVDEGTWGWDYAGHCLPSRIILDWFHGRRCQGGAGAYATDGPRPCEELERRHEE
jgi:hypothetical protein